VPPQVIQEIAQGDLRRRTDKEQSVRRKAKNHSKSSLQLENNRPGIAELGGIAKLLRRSRDGGDAGGHRFRVIVASVVCLDY
jgi:hypothetical protein